MQAENEYCYSDEIELDLDDDLELSEGKAVYIAFKWP